MSESWNYAILGTGALGGLYGGLLARAGREVHFLARSDAEHLQAQGLKVESPLGNFEIPVKAYASASEMPAVDVAVVSWKTTANSVLASVLPQVLKPEGVVLVLQNGWQVEQEAAQVVGAERVLGGCCFLCSNKVGPGHVRHLDYGAITFGEYESSRVGAISQRMLDLEAVFRDAGIDMIPIKSLPVARWKKLAWNIPFNGLSVVLQANTQEIMQNPNTCRLASDLMNEVSQAAKTCGYEFDDEHIAKMLNATREMVPYDSSMYLDYKSQRPIEVESIVGNPMRCAIEHGFRPKKIEMLYEQLCFLDARNCSKQPIGSTTTTIRYSYASTD